MMTVLISVTGIATGFLLGAVWSLVFRVQPIKTQLLDLMQSLETDESLATDSFDPGWIVCDTRGSS